MPETCPYHVPNMGSGSSAVIAQDCQSSGAGLKLGQRHCLCLLYETLKPEGPFLSIWSSPGDVKDPPHTPRVNVYLVVDSQSGGLRL